MRPLLGVALAALMALPAQAADITPLLTDSKVYRNARDGSEMRYDIWYLFADGTVRGNYRVSRPVTRGGRYVWRGTIAGRWTVEDSTLCLDAEGLEDTGPICYEIRKGGFARNEFVATNKETGFNWQVFVYRQNG
ncbi:MAG: hypothetical protein QNJ94_04330 [Alphaproteobacteria bacterium]|nr:hypothetical protein [Alphaproteobacteria bacterium]